MLTEGSPMSDWSDQTNVYGEPLTPCNLNPRTGFYRSGCCETGPEDLGLHLICAEMTAEFLEFSRKAGNDLSTPRPEYGFAGLKPGDRWCLCAGPLARGPRGGCCSPRCTESHARGNTGCHPPGSAEGLCARPDLSGRSDPLRRHAICEGIRRGPVAVSTPDARSTGALRQRGVPAPACANVWIRTSTSWSRRTARTAPGDGYLQP